MHRGSRQRARTSSRASEQAQTRQNWNFVSSSVRWFVRLFVVAQIDKRKSDSSPALYRDTETIAVRVWKVTVVPEWIVSRCLNRKISR